VNLRLIAVPAALRALDRVAHLAEQVGEDEALWSTRLRPDMFDAGTQARTTVGFALRATLPLVGQEVPSLSGSLPARLSTAMQLIKPLDFADFEGAERRRIKHRAGFADLDQDGLDYLINFALPNMWFHLSMAYASLRAAGLPLGKADFDGLHQYPAGFRWN
jgi:uncharacterized protein